MMRKILGTMLALAITGWPLPAGQEPDAEKSKQKKEEPKKQPPKPTQESQEKQKPKADKTKQEPAPPPKQKENQKQQQQPEKERQKQQEKAQKEQSKQSTKTQQQPRQTAESSRQTQETPRGARAKGQKIPREKFRANFGREHQFRVTQREDRRFRYSGYWFEVVEVWPAGWSFDDECYLEEDGDDYYLVSIVHPEIRVLLIVVS